MKDELLDLRHRKPKAPEDDIGSVDTSLELFQKVYRNPNLPLHTRLRAARDAKDHEHPKLVATAVVNEGSFAALLERAIARSNGHKVIEGEKVIEHEAEGSLTANQPTAREVSADHLRRPIHKGIGRGITRRI
jgi:hypothetical protein